MLDFYCRHCTVLLSLTSSPAARLVLQWDACAPTGNLLGIPYLLCALSYLDKCRISKHSLQHHGSCTQWPHAEFLGLQFRAIHHPERCCC